MNEYDDCTVTTDMPLSDEVADFIEKGLNGDVDVKEWCDNNLDNIAEIYEKYGHSYMSYRDAELVLVFAKTLYENKISDAREKLSLFVACQD
jgi:hypothetical protein